MRKLFTSAVIAATLALTACATNDPYTSTPTQNPWGVGTKQTVGAVAGAVAGGLAGSQIGNGSGQLWATGAGALLGTFIGSEVGKSLDKADIAYAKKAEQQAYTAPLNQKISWNNPESGNYGSYVPVKEGKDQTTGNSCRQYQQTIVVEGQSQTAFGTACQQADGTWTLVNG